jgi:chemotaxis signal transduction protein
VPEGEFVAFRVARQSFLMQASRVRHIVPAHGMARLEHSRSCVVGVTSIGGREIPVADLRRKLGISIGISRSVESYIVVVDIQVDGSAEPIGFLVDRMSGVLTLRERDFRNGSVRLQGRVRRVLDPDEVFSRGDWSLSR